MVTAERPTKRIEFLIGQCKLLDDLLSDVLAAIAGCVAGDTLIDTPRGQQQIKDIAGFNEVMALTDRGVECMPAFIFRKGMAQLYRVTLDNGQTIEATLDHYLLVSDSQTLRWCSVGDLLPMLSGRTPVSVVSIEPTRDDAEWLEGYLPVHRQSTPAPCQSVHPLGVRHSSHRVSDCREYYSGGSHPYDAQPLRVIDNDQSPTPLLGGVLGYSHQNSNVDGRGISLEHNHPCLSSCHQSRSSSVPLLGHDSSGLCRASPYICVQSRGHGQERSPSHTLTSGFPSPTVLDGLFQSVSSSSDVPYNHLQFLLSHSLSKIASIVPTTITSYYDMIVPHYHNYLAQGMVHHNTGGGKTVLGYWWLHSRMEKYPGNTWAMAEPTWGMLDKVILNSSDPERLTLEQYFKAVNHHPIYHKGERILKTDFGQIYLYTAENPDSMQGAPVRGYWLDEPGLMVLKAYETALQRVSMMGGQILLTTTPYNLGWLKSEVFERNGTNGIHVERWRSVDRPGFPRESYEAMKKKLPPWRFAMLYDALFEHPEGLIYNAFNEHDCLVNRFPIPKEWPVYVGHDFGASNPAALFYAIDPATGIKWLFHEYLPGPGKSAHEHVLEWEHITKGYNVLVRMGGSHQEEETRQLYAAHGWHIQEPNDVNKVETQILRVIGEHQRNRIKVFRDLIHYLDEKRTFSRQLGDDQKPIDKIDNEAAFHLMAAERYIISYFQPETMKLQSAINKVRVYG